MASISTSALRDYRDQTFRYPLHLRLHSADDAVRYVDERGFIFFWPNRDVLVPSLWAATAGDRPVADDHDDAGHITWGWKDDLLGHRRWYYGRVLRKRNAMLSNALTPYLYALTENYGSPEEDYLLQYEEGHLTQEAKAVYETLLEHGPLHSIDLRKKSHLSSAESNGRFNRALDALQMDMKILPVGVAKAGAWHYAFIYDITARHLPDLPEQSRPIGEKAARVKLVETYLQSVGAARQSDVVKLFGWPVPVVERTLAALVEAGQLCPPVELPGQPGEWYALPQLVE